MKKKNLIAQFGTFEVENYGDRLFPIILEKELASRLSSFELQLFSPLDKREHVYPIFQKDGSVTPCFAEAVVIGGGDLISFGTDITTDYDQGWHQLIGAHSACWAIPSIHLAKTASILWNAPGVPVPFTEEQAVLVRALTSQADYLSVRDEISKNLLRQAGVKGSIEIVPDTALLMPRHFSPEDLKPIAEKIVASLQLALGEYLIFQAQPGLESHIPEITKTLYELSKNLQKKVLLLPIGYCHNDQGILSKICVESTGTFQLILDKLDHRGTAALIAHAACFVGTSLHGNVTAFAYGIPHLIYNASNLKKLEGFSQVIQEPERLILSYKEISGKTHLLSKIPSRSTYKTLTNQIDSHFDKIAQYISHPTARSLGKPSPDVLEDFLRLLHEHQRTKKAMHCVEKQLEAYESSFLLREFVLFRKLLQRFKVLSSSFRNRRFWLFRFGICVLKLAIKNCRKFFKILFKYLYILFENYPVKILPLHEWQLAIHSKGSESSLLHRIQEDLGSFSNKPIISFILPIHKTNIAHLKETIHSTCHQYYNNWELCIAGNLNPDMRELIEQKSDPRIKVALLSNSGPLSTCFNSALELATGEWIALLGQDDVLPLDALYEVTRKINLHPEADFIYSDEDKLNQNGLNVEPFYKPSWCPDSFLSRNYILSLAVIRRELVSRVGGFRADFEGAEEYDLFLRIMELTDRVFHIPKILYHRRTSTNSQELRKNEAGLRALREAISRRKWSAHVESNSKCVGCYTIRYEPRTSHKISILIPTKNQTAVIKKCIDSIYEKTTHQNYEVIVVSNNSTEQSLFSLLQSYKNVYGDRFDYYENNIPFNFSRLMNEAASKAKGENFLFLNNDTEVITPDWLQEMAGHVERESIGAVGCKLLYFNNTIQHAGVVMEKGVGRHVFVGEPRNSPGYFSHLNTVNNYSAVTAACLMCRKDLFDAVNGFDENLKVAFNDVDFCLKLKERGYNNIYLPHVELYHYESLSRGSHLASKESSKQFSTESEIMHARWEKYIKYDPCFSMHLTSGMGNV
jgi:GT2 family glycosyltransferase/polysaccharide pyruvyl transferase WcaK-like protein